MRRVKITPPEPREYLVSVTAWSTERAWIKAFSESAAMRRAKRQWREDASGFIAKAGDISSVDVVTSRPATDT